MSRRRVVLGLVVALLVAAVLTWRLTRTRTLGAKVTHITLSSRVLHQQMPLTLVAPAGAGAGRPLLVFLHGRGGDQNSELSDQMFAALRAAGSRAPDIVFPYGGDHSYWHNRAGGAWASYVLDEVIPAAIRALHADPRRVAIGGISMGGFGAYDIARLDPARFCAVGGHSAAIFPSAALTAPGAFDDAADFARNNLIAFAAAHPRPYGHASLWLDGGTQDPFHDADESFAHELHVHMHVWPGGHDSDYWNAHWHNYIPFYANALAHCR